MKKMKKYLNIFHEVKIPWFLLFLLFITGIVAAQVEVRSVKITADIIDSHQNTIRLDRLLRYLGYLAATVACGVSSTWIGGIAYGRINKGVREKTFRHLMKLPQSFYDREAATEIVSRIVVDSSSAAYYFEILLSTFGAVYAAFVVFVNLFGYNRVMGRYSLLVIPISVGVAVIYGWFTYTAARKEVNSAAVTTGYLFERTAALRTIKAFNTQKEEMKTANKMFGKMFEAEMMTEMALAFVQVGMQLIGCASIVISFVFGAKMVQAKILTIGELVAYYTLSGSVGIQLINLFLNYGSFRSINGCLKNIADILAEKTESKEGRELEDEQKDIRFRNVSFAYDKNKVLDNVSFTIEKQKVTAVIGTNGAGKSTVFKLMERMYDPSDGMILYGDTKITEYSLSSWREQLAVVSQGTELISGTIRANMCYGAKKPVTEEYLMEVAAMCGLKEFIEESEEGLDRMIHVGSTNLSGGQRQSLAIARAIIKDSPYLLLDEATKSLDAYSESVAIQALKELMKGRTTIMIAHNPSAILHADQIIVMKDGHVEDIGTPSELEERNDYYKTFMSESGVKE